MSLLWITHWKSARFYNCLPLPCLVQNLGAGTPLDGRTKWESQQCVKRSLTHQLGIHATSFPFEENNPGTKREGSWGCGSMIHSLRDLMRLDLQIELKNQSCLRKKHWLVTSRVVCEGSVRPGGLYSMMLLIVAPSWTYYSFQVPSASFNSSPCTLGSVALIPITHKQILVLEKADPLRLLFLQEPLFFQSPLCLLTCKYSAMINTVLFLFDPAAFKWEGWESQRHRHIYTS